MAQLYETTFNVSTSNVVVFDSLTIEDSVLLRKSGLASALVELTFPMIYSAFNGIASAEKLNILHG